MSGGHMANGKPLAKADANIKKNRLHVTIAGNVDVKSLEKLYTDVRFCVADLKEGFEVISDISQCNLIYISGMPVYKKIIDYLIANKVGAIVRIIKNDNVSFRQIVNFSEKIHCYRSIYAENKAEAERKLEQLVKRDGNRFQLNTIRFQYEHNNQVGAGTMADISVSGCAVENPSLALAEGDDIVITFNFDHHDTFSSEFQMKARVVRCNEHLFAAHFYDLEDEVKAQLYKRLAFEVSRIPFFL
jgi:hypothetical protein